MNAPRTWGTDMDRDTAKAQVRQRWLDDRTGATIDAVDRHIGDTLVRSHASTLAGLGFLREGYGSLIAEHLSDRLIELEAQRLMKEQNHD